MSPNAPLDLSSLDPAIWRVEVNGEVYGPYTLGQMQSFVREGRVGRETQVSCGVKALPQAAALFPKLAPVFGDVESVKPAPAEASNFVIIARIDAETPMETRSNLSRTLNGLGKFAEAMPGTFVLRTADSLPDVRRALSEGAPDTRIMIVEAREGRLGWLDLGPDADRHIRTVWNSDLT